MYAYLLLYEIFSWSRIYFYDQTLNNAVLRSLKDKTHCPLHTVLMTIGMTVNVNRNLMY